MPIEKDYLTFDCDMNSGAVLRIMKQPDGDIVLSIYDPEGGSDGKGAMASVEFCTPFVGGGRHDRLWKNLAMFFDKEMKDAIKDDPRKFELRVRAD